MQAKIQQCRTQSENNNSTVDVKSCDWQLAFCIMSTTRLLKQRALGHQQHLCNRLSLAASPSLGAKSAPGHGPQQMCRVVALIRPKCRRSLVDQADGSTKTNMHQTIPKSKDRTTMRDRAKPFKCWLSSSLPQEKPLQSVILTCLVEEQHPVNHNLVDAKHRDRAW